MKRFLECVVLTVLLIISSIVLLGCGRGGSTTGSTEGAAVASGGVQFFTAPWGIAQIRKGSQDLIKRYYLIGNCVNIDDAATNIHSYEFEVRGGEYYFRDKPGCLGSKFKFNFADYGGGKLFVQAEIGPLETNYHSLKLALDGLRNVIVGVDSLHNRIVIGCERINFEDIPDCGFIRDAGPVGAIKIFRGPIEMFGRSVAIRRTPAGSNFLRFQCHKHPHTFNCDLEIRNPSYGKTLVIEEEIWVR